MIKNLLQKIKPIPWNDQTAKVSVRIANYVLAFAILAGFWVAGQAVRQPDKEAFASIMNIAKLPVWLTMASNNNNNNNNCTTSMMLQNGFIITSTDCCGDGGTCDNEFTTKIYNASSDPNSEILSEHQSAINQSNDQLFNDMGVNVSAASNITDSTDAISNWNSLDI